MGDSDGSENQEAERRASPPPSSVITFDEQGVVCRRASGLVESARWDDLRAVFVVTTSQGPAVDDVFFVLAGDTSGCAVPSEAGGCGGLLERLQKLPRFDHEALIEAMSCTDDRTFVCWWPE